MNWLDADTYQPLLERSSCELQAAGSNVIGIAGDINAAMKLIESECIDHVVLDAELRGRSAEPVAKLLRQREIQFIVVIGYGPNQLDWIGDASHIQMPFDCQKIAHFDFVRWTCPAGPVFAIIHDWFNSDCWHKAPKLSASQIKLLTRLGSVGLPAEPCLAAPAVFARPANASSDAHSRLKQEAQR